MRVFWRLKSFMKIQLIENSEKWLSAHKWASELKDHLNKPLDPGIVYTVTVFKYLGIHTTMSCEGHLDGGFAAPWVMVLSPQGDQVEQKVFEYMAKHKSNELPKKLRKARIDIIPHNFAYSKPLAKCLEKFYKTRKTTWLNRLIISWNIDGELRLINQGAWLNEYEPKSVKKRNLANFRKEMLSFTKFLLTNYK